MSTKRRRYPDDRSGAGQLKPVATSRHNNCYSVFWKDVDNQDKGTIWLYLPKELVAAGEIARDEGIPLWVRGQRTSLIKARGRKWHAVFPDQIIYAYLASPLATKKVMASIVSRWGNPPLMLRCESGPTFSLQDLRTVKHSYVYLVHLLTFDQTSSGRRYYKIGKAKSIPSRIKQFGPCRLVDSIQLSSEADSLRVETELHGIFACLRKPGTEIFCMNEAELQVVIAEYLRYKNERPQA
jgi:hypothetical protein